MFTQQTLGASCQAAAYYQYVVTGQDLDDPFSNWYTSVMENDYQLMKLADQRADNQYSGISRILMAFALQQVVDAWGSTPYSQAFNGLDNVHPAYDKDVDLYTTMGKLVDDGIAFINNASPGPDDPSQHGEDVIYGGDASKWIKFGHAIKARLAIHQSKGNIAMANAALAEAALSFTSNDDNAKYPFSTDETGANARYQYNENRGDISYTSSTLATMMATNNDPRYQSLFDSTFNDVNLVGLGAYYGEPNAVAEFITYEEIQHIKAEAILRISGDFAAATTEDTIAIRASFNRLGLKATGVDSTADSIVLHNDSVYIANHLLPTTTVNDAIAAVAYESWVSNFLNPEAWATWRRTNAPMLTPVSGSQIPRRFLYTQSEHTFNGENTPSSTLYTPKLFWDN
jgi:hypothetical protein